MAASNFLTAAAAGRDAGCEGVTTAGLAAAVGAALEPPAGGGPATKANEKEEQNSLSRLRKRHRTKTDSERRAGLRRMCVKRLTRRTGRRSEVGTDCGDGCSGRSSRLLCRRGCFCCCHILLDCSGERFRRCRCSRRRNAHRRHVPRRRRRQVEIVAASERRGCDGLQTELLCTRQEGVRHADRLECCSCLCG